MNSATNALHLLGAIGLALLIAWLLWRLLAPHDSAEQPGPETRLPEDDQGPDNDRGMW